MDTLELREMALDLEQVRADQRISNTQWARLHIAKRAMFDAADALDHLTSAIAKAPHAIRDGGCDYEATKTAGKPLPCSCWKSKL